MGPRRKSGGDDGVGIEALSRPSLPAAAGREAPRARCTIPVEPPNVIPAPAGIQFGVGTTCERKLDPRLRGDDGVRRCRQHPPSGCRASSGRRAGRSPPPLTPSPLREGWGGGRLLGTAAEPVGPQPRQPHPSGATPDSLPWRSSRPRVTRHRRGSIPERVVRIGETEPRRRDRFEPRPKRACPATPFGTEDAAKPGALMRLGSAVGGRFQPPPTPSGTEGPASWPVRAAPGEALRRRTRAARLQSSTSVPSSADIRHDPDTPISPPPAVRRDLAFGEGMGGSVAQAEGAGIRFFDHRT